MISISHEQRDNPTVSWPDLGYQLATNAPVARKHALYALGYNPPRYPMPAIVSDLSADYVELGRREAQESDYALFRYRFDKRYPTAR